MCTADAFPRAVRNAIGTGVPCLRPYSGIKLLQIINHCDVEWHGMIRRRHVLINPGKCAATLITRMPDANLKQELQGFVDDAYNADELRICTMDARLVSSLKAGVYGDITMNDTDLVNVGLKMIHDKGWKLSFGDGIVRTRSVLPDDLNPFLKRADVKFKLESIKAVVTTIYYFKGGLTFTGDSKDVINAGATLEATPHAPVNITVGWHYKVTTTGSVVVAEDNPTEWVVAIEYQQVKMGKTEKNQLVHSLTPNNQIVCHGI